QIPLLFHRIKAHSEWGQLSDNEWKQECERTAFPSLLRELRHQFPRLRLCIHLDALYATDPNFILLKELKMGYSMVRKAKVLKSVGSDCEGLKMFSQPLKIKAENKRFKIQQVIHFFNDVAYRGHKLSIISLNESAEKKTSKRFAKVKSKKTHWEWIVHQALNNENTYPIATRSRICWKEEDLFNDLNFSYVLVKTFPKIMFALIYSPFFSQKTFHTTTSLLPDFFYYFFANITDNYLK
ncbi:MAG: hypothetical protein P4L16_01195, partial [Chlamydiales bacterium]|nr:hypothetical protein [Chlamydiales bacterium]